MCLSGNVADIDGVRENDETAMLSNSVIVMSCHVADIDECQGEG